jgi:hypothetical protein
MATTSNQSPTYGSISTAPLPLGQAIRELPGQYFKVLTRPSIKTFVEEKDKAGWGIIWLQFIGLGIIDAIISVVAILISPAAVSSVPNAGGLSLATLQTVAIITAAVLQLVLTPLSFLFAGGILYLISRVFGGRGKFVEQIYVTLLFGVPLVFLSALLSLIPGVGSWLLYVPHIYSLVLIVLALIAVHRRSEGSAEQSVPAQRN